MKELTEEQIEKAAISLWQIMGVERNQTWRDLAEVYKEAYREKAKLLAQMLQYAPAPPQLSGDVVRDACAAFVKVLDSFQLPDWNPKFQEAMTAAVQGVLDKIYAAISNKLMDDYHFSRKHATGVAAEICNSILKPAPPTLEEELSKFAWETVITNKDWTRESLQAGIREILNRRASEASHDR